MAGGGVGNRRASEPLAGCRILHEGGFGTVARSVIVAGTSGRGNRLYCMLAATPACGTNVRAVGAVAQGRAPHALHGIVKE